MFKWMVCRFSFMCVVVFFTVAVLPPRNTRADLFVDVQDATLTSGGFGSIDVLVSSMGGTDTFSLLNYQFKITPINIVNGGYVEFTGQQSNSEQDQADYIFAGSTSEAKFFSARSASNTLLLDGSDERVGGNIDVTGPTKYLLARLELQHITLSPELSGGTFRVSLVESPALSFFENTTPLVGQAQPRIHDSSYSLAGSGIVTIISAVPEPSSLSLVALSLCLAWRRRRA
jgi:hypothetical protein